MPTTISGTSGVTFPAGGVGNPAGAVVGTTDTQTLTNKTLTTPNIDSAQIATVSGTAPLYMARAWVNFNGTGTVAIRASGNVTSITDSGTGLYVVNFTTAMSDANFSRNVSSSDLTLVDNSSGSISTSTTVGIRVINLTGTNVDSSYVSVSVFR